MLTLEFAIEDWLNHLDSVFLLPRNLQEGSGSVTELLNGADVQFLLLLGFSDEHQSFEKSLLTVETSVICHFIS